MILDKERIKQESKRWLSANGWPHMTDPDLFVVNNLDEIFAHLLRLGLVPPNSYDIFVTVATMKWQEKMMGGF